MRAVLPSVAALLLGTGLLLLGNGLLGTLLGVKMSLLGRSTTVTGLVMSAYFAGLVAGAMWSHRLLRNVGHIRVFAALASGFSAATLLHGLLEPAYIWALLRFLEGFCAAGLYMCIESWLNEKAGNETRGSILSLYMLTVYAGLAAGQMLLPLFDPAGFALLALSSVLVSVALIPVALTRMPGPTIPRPSLLGLRELARLSPLGALGCLTGGLTGGAFYGLAPVYAQQLRLGSWEIALFMTAAILGGMLLQWPLGKLSDRFDRRRLIVGLAAGVALVSLATTRADDLGLMALMAAAAAFGGLAFPLYSISVAHANDQLDPTELVPAAGGLLMFYSLGSTAGPIMATQVMQRAGNDGLFLHMAAVCSVTSAFGLWRTLTQPAMAAAAQVPYQPVPQTSLAVAELDPRMESAQLEFDFSAPAPEPETVTPEAA